MNFLGHFVFCGLKPVYACIEIGKTLVGHQQNTMQHPFVTSTFLGWLKLETMAKN